MVEQLPGGEGTDMADLAVEEVRWLHLVALAVPGGRVVEIGPVFVLPTYALALLVRAALLVNGQPRGFPLGSGVLAAFCTGVSAEVRSSPMQAVAAPRELIALDMQAIACVWASLPEAHGAEAGTLPTVSVPLVAECVAALAQWMVLRGEFAGLAHLGAALLPGRLAGTQCWFYGAHCGGGHFRWGKVVPS